MSNKASRKARSIIDKEACFELEASLTLMITHPMKKALTLLASTRQTSVSDIVRMTLAQHVSDEFPEFKELYEEVIIEAHDKFVEDYKEYANTGDNIKTILKGMNK